MRYFVFGLVLVLASCKPAGPPPVPGPFAKGERIYYSRCITCHQRDGSGLLNEKRFAADFTDPGGVLVRQDAELTAIIMNGLEGRYGRMPAFKPILEEEDVAEVLNYIRFTFIKSAPIQEAESRTEE